MFNSWLMIGIGLCLAPYAGAETLGLDQAVDLAVQNNRTLRIAALDIAKSRDRLAAVKTRQLPNFSLFMLGSQQLRAIDFTFERGLLGTFPNVGPIPAADVQVRTPLRPTGFFVGRISQPLSTLYRIRLNLRTLETSVQLAEEQTRVERHRIVREVKRVYYGIQQVEASLATVSETLKLYREVERLTQQYVEQQVALKGDLLDIQTRLAKVEQSEITLRNREASGKEQLNQIMGRDVLMEFSVQPVNSDSPAEFDIETARKRAMEQRPELLQAHLRREQAERDLRAKNAERIPDVAAEFNSLTLLNFSGFLPVQSNSVGLSLSWEPFDWGRKRREAAEKRHTLQQAENAGSEAESLVLVDVNDKFRRLGESRAQLRVARLAQETAIEKLRVIKNKYELEAALLKDVLEGQTRVEQSNADYQQALVDFWNARADFERALGEDR